jgi:hypothetical protein
LGLVDRRKKKERLRQARVESAVDHTDSEWAKPETRVGARWITPDLGENSKEYIPVSEATRRLMEGMFGGLPQTPDVKSWRAVALPVISYLTYSNPRRKEAGERVAEAVRSGEMNVYVVGPKNIGGAVSVEFLFKLIRSKGEIPNRPRRWPSMVSRGWITAELYDELQKDGVLLAIRKRDFEEWYEAEKQKGKWPSQSAKKKSGQV